MAAEFAATDLLFERDFELAQLLAALRGCADGRGGVVVVEGPAGIGKSALLRSAVEDTSVSRLQLLRARGVPLESEMPFALAQQLLAPALARLPSGTRKRVLAGPAGRAEAALGVLGDQPAIDDAAAIYSLYWVAANLADERPTAFVVDDAHWADAESLRWLSFLGARSDDHPLSVIVAARLEEHERTYDLLAALIEQHRGTRLPLRPLSLAGTRRFVREVHGSLVEEQFCKAVHEITRGNPFLLAEALRDLAADGFPATAESAAHVLRLGPPEVARSVLLRIGRLGPAALKLTRALSVLGRSHNLLEVSEVADVGAQEAAEAADRLAGAAIVGSEQPLEFIHPVVRTAVYEDIPAWHRARLHAVAARVLLNRGASWRTVGGHLLETEPSHDEEMVPLLVACAEEERDPTRAAALLRRALDEPAPTSQRGRLLLQLGQAEARAYRPSALTHLAEAAEILATGDALDQVVSAQARAMTLAGDPKYVVGWARRQLARLEIGDRSTVDPELLYLLRALETIFGELSADGAQRLTVEAWPAEVPEQRYLLAALAYRGPEWTTAEHALSLARRVFERGVGEAGPRGMGYVLTWNAFLFADDPASAAALDLLGLGHARREGDLSGYARALTLHSLTNLAAGELRDAHENAVEALHLTRDGVSEWSVPFCLAAAVAALAEQGRNQEAEQLLSAHPLTDWQKSGARASSLEFSRGVLRQHQGRYDDAITSYLAAGEGLRRYGTDHPADLPWRSGAALCHLALGERDEALRLTEEELVLAKTWRAPRSLGRALRVYGLALGGSGGAQILEEAAQAMISSQAALEHGWVLADCGSAVRREGSRTRARAYLRKALELAEQCHASVLYDMAESELKLTGARSRRRDMNGAASLTPAERRVARLAAAGNTNREIAQELFLSVRTVEAHMRQVLAKLDVRSRNEVSHHLAAGTPRVAQEGSPVAPPDAPEPTPLTA
jgi:DNA-binding CsgD family transcriptional regulator